MKTLMEQVVLAIGAAGFVTFLVGGAMEGIIGRRPPGAIALSGLGMEIFALVLMVAWPMAKP